MCLERTVDLRGVEREQRRQRSIGDIAVGAKLAHRIPQDGGHIADDGVETEQLLGKDR